MRAIDNLKKPRALIAALVSVVVVLTTTLGTLDAIPAGLHGVIQGLGTISGIYLGYVLAVDETGSRMRVAAQVGVRQALSLKRQLDNAALRWEQFRERTERSASSATVRQEQLSSAILLATVQLEQLYPQLEQTAESWAQLAGTSVADLVTTTDPDSERIPYA